MEKKIMPQEQEKKKEERYELVEVPTQTGIFIRDNENEVVMDDKEALLQILRMVNEIKKSVA